MSVTEDYCSFELGKLLKEKGFDSPVQCTYDEYGVVSERWTEYSDDYTIRHWRTPCVTHQMALKWLREKCDIYVEIIFYSITKPVLYRWCASKNGRVVSDEEKPDTNVVKCFIHGDDKNFTIHYCTYEDAVEAAIKYCLTNLI